MAEVPVCGHAEVIPDDCAECGFWLHIEVAGGYPAQIGRVCSENCAATQSTRIAAQRIDEHLRLRDLLCACPEVCAPRGLPTSQQHAQYAAYRAETRPVDRESSRRCPHSPDRVCVGCGTDEQLAAALTAPPPTPAPGEDTPDAGIHHGCEPCRLSVLALDALARVWDPHGQWDLNLTGQARQILRDVLHQHLPHPDDGGHRG